MKSKTTFFDVPFSCKDPINLKKVGESISLKEGGGGGEERPWKRFYIQCESMNWPKMYCID